jgi:hypothetical protein
MMRMENKFYLLTLSYSFERNDRSHSGKYSKGEFNVNRTKKLDDID